MSQINEGDLMWFDPNPRLGAVHRKVFIGVVIAENKNAENCWYVEHGSTWYLRDEKFLLAVTPEEALIYKLES